MSTNIEKLSAAVRALNLKLETTVRSFEVLKNGYDCLTEKFDNLKRDCEFYFETVDEVLEGVVDILDQIVEPEEELEDEEDFEDEEEPELLTRLDAIEKELGGVTTKLQNLLYDTMYRFQSFEEIQLTILDTLKDMVDHEESAVEEIEDEGPTGEATLVFYSSDADGLGGTFSGGRPKAKLTVEEAVKLLNAERGDVW